ncbi:hypothetical protein GV827_03130 [Sulfitobacter sp. JBTF-M27]|uniref:Copper chaperone PCu(A)C n=1 Tax=Sulfitobacter sediminilitoris TaxID=2698830 RepID=A0A6P0C8H3_9RHOB|nr:hypothetical protein [Sulfitobacter sediminilitoris]NEK21396.1 hypothetical protein [Sulfitobacter sediminilitoris]
MSRTLSLFVIGLIFGGGIGFTIAAGNGITFDGHDHGDPAHHDAAMDHGSLDHAIMHDTPLDVPAADAPRLSIELHPDPLAGFNLHVMTDNFAFSPQNAGVENVTGEGHAHVYINGEKLGRLYGAWMHLDNLPKGEVEVEVTLNTNDHRPLAVDGTPVTARQTITVE